MDASAREDGRHEINDDDLVKAFSDHLGIPSYEEQKNK